MEINFALPKVSDELTSQMRSIIVDGLRGQVTRQSTDLVNLEQDEDGIAYIELLRLLRSDTGTSALVQEANVLYDKIFYIADSITPDNAGGLELRVAGNNFVRLNDKIPVNGLPTINELRKAEKPGILFSGVGAIQISSKDGILIPLLQRDSGAPTDAGKYTLPAGRADKTPGLTAYEELLEEIVLFGVKDGVFVQIVPFLKDGGISEEKAKQLASMAKGRYINSLIKKGDTNLSLNYISQLISTEIMIEPLSISEGGVDIKTIFSDNIDTTVVEGGFFPVHDTAVNTVEFVRGFQLNLSDYDGIQVGDGDGFGRDAKLFSEAELETIGSENMVASLRGAIEQGVFGSK